jgi:hypothetical protein
LRKIVSILLLLVYLGCATQLKELIKLPILISHFVEHQKENHSISIFEFMRMHYANGDPHDEDYQEDMKLPFKTISAPISGFDFIVFNVTPLFLFEQTIIYFSSQKIILNTSMFQFELYDSVWQPPKSC